MASIMGKKYQRWSLEQLEARWNEMQKRLSVLPADQRPEKDMEELFFLRKEIARRKYDIPKTDIDVNYTEQYLTD